MPKIPLAFVGPAYESRSLTLDAQRCVNLYPELAESPNPKDVAVLHGTPGLAVLQTFPGQGGIRGMHVATKGNRPFVVQADKLIELTSPTTSVERGTLTGNGTRVSMDNTSLELCVVANRRGWILNLATNVFQEITDPDFLPTDTVISLDEFFLFNHSGTNQFFHSLALDGLSYLGPDFASAQSSPDLIVGLHRSHSEMWVFGTQTVEVFVNTGALSRPFQPLQNPFIEQGTASPFTMVELNEVVYWVGGNDKGPGIVWRAVGYAPQRISTHAIETALNQVDQASITTFGYQEEGHWFFVVQTLAHTWVFDAATQLWHERGRLGIDGLIKPHDGWLHMHAFGRHILGSQNTGTVYESSLDTYTNAEEPLPRIRVAPYWHTARERTTHVSLEIDMEVGVGQSVASGPALDPQMSLSWSDTHGQTWSNEHPMSLGKQGEFRVRAKRRQLGRPYDRAYRMRFTAAAKFAMFSGYLQVR